MNRKLKNTLGLVVLLIIILLGAGIYIFLFQKNEIKEKTGKLKELKANDYNAEQLNLQYQELLIRSSVLDSVLASRTFNIPANLSSIKFFDFVNEISAGFSETTHSDVEFIETKPERDFFVYEYKITGGGEFNDVYRLIFAIEQSKELKKIKGISLSNLISNDKEGIPHFQVSFSMDVQVYFATNNRFATAALVENNLSAGAKYDIFFPLIRNEIPPNFDELLDVQGAKLLALIPEGAFFADSRGNTFLLYEGEQVYLGYLTDIDYDKNKVTFILNKGGIIETVNLFLEKEQFNKRPQ